MRFGICGLLFLALVAPHVGCRRIARAREEAAKAEAREEARAADHEYEQLVAGKDEDGDRAMEARLYLAPNQPKYGLGKVAREHAVKWVDELYRAGAVKVYVVYTPGEGPRINSCIALLVELPPAGEVRAKVLAAYNRIDRQLARDSEAEVDNGQKFLYLDTES
jgi:hypothetical protein